MHFGERFVFTQRFAVVIFQWSLVGLPADCFNQRLCVSLCSLLALLYLLVSRLFKHRWIFQVKSSCLLHLSLLGCTPSERQGFGVMALRWNAQKGKISAFLTDTAKGYERAALGNCYRHHVEFNIRGFNDRLIKWLIKAPSRVSIRGGFMSLFFVWLLIPRHRLRSDANFLF